MLNKFLFVLLLIIRSPGTSTHYRMVKIDNRKACVEANVTAFTARKFSAKPGNCADRKCVDYAGSQRVPFCCFVNGYYCP